ncbi:MAG: hypothetical protein IKT51_02675 [Phascolarctobacterium sp.]|nr:hypothetical protein [Phascolarctobacterium sp.]
MDISNINTIVSLIVLGVTYFIVQPLQVSIQGLQKTMEKLTEAVDGLRKDNTAIQVHVKEVEQVAKSAQKRCDDLADRVHEVEQRCINCTCRKE